MPVLLRDPDGKPKLAVGVSEMVGRKPLACVKPYCTVTAREATWAYCCLYYNCVIMQHIIMTNDYET